MSNKPLSATQRSGGRSASNLNSALRDTLHHAEISKDDLLASGWTIEDMARCVSATPPFSDVLRRAVEEWLMQ